MLSGAGTVKEKKGESEPARETERMEEETDGRAEQEMEVVGGEGETEGKKDGSGNEMDHSSDCSSGEKGKRSLVTNTFEGMLRSEVGMI